MIRATLIRESDDTVIGEADYIAAPITGSDVMWLGRDWQRYVVVGVTYWPYLPASNDIVDGEATPARLVLRVRFVETLA